MFMVDEANTIADDGQIAGERNQRQGNNWTDIFVGDLG
jgi:hypothetical protein